MGKQELIESLECIANCVSDKSSEDEPPVWTDAHIDELLNDFIVIPKDTKPADVQPVKQESMNKCYFCDNEINSDLTIKIYDKTLLQSELFRAKMCPKCSEVLKASITLLKHTRRGK